MAIAWLQERYVGVKNDLAAHGNGRGGGGGGAGVGVGVGGPN